MKALNFMRGSCEGLCPAASYRRAANRTGFLGVGQVPMSKSALSSRASERNSLSASCIAHRDRSMTPKARTMTIATMSKEGVFMV